MATDRLSAIFASLADPTRRAILARLAEAPASVSELAEPFTMSMQAVSRHLKVLERAGLISRHADAQTRWSRLEPDALAEATAWTEHYRRFWDTNLDRLDDHLRRLQVPDTPPSREDTA